MNSGSDVQHIGAVLMFVFSQISSHNFTRIINFS